MAAQAFHWFRADEAAAEIHRVLKAGGGLGLIWNARDEANEWNRELTRIIEAHEGSTPRYKSFAWRTPFDTGRLFSPLEKAEFPHVQTVSREALEDRVGSISFIADGCTRIPTGKRSSNRCATWWSVSRRIKLKAKSLFPIGPTSTPAGEFEVAAVLLMDRYGA